VGSNLENIITFPMALELTQVLTEMSIGNVCAGKGWPARNSVSLTTISEAIL
jgi:hypothetical protein